MITFRTASAEDISALSKQKATGLLEELSLYTLVDGSNDKLKALADTVGIEKAYQLKKDDKVIALLEVRRGSPLPKDYRELIKTSRTDLYERAKDEDVSGRGSMSRADFIAHFAEDLDADAPYYDPDPIDADQVYLAILTEDQTEVVGYTPREIWPGISTYGVPTSWDDLVEKRKRSKPFYRDMYWDRIVQVPPPGTPVQTPPNLPMPAYQRAEETVKAALSQDS